jgi:hypothetical protein
MNTKKYTPRATPPSKPSLLVIVLIATVVGICVPILVHAQPAKTDAEHLVPPQGSTADIPVHMGAVCILSFPEKLLPKALSSSADFEVQAWGEDGIAVRAVNKRATPATVALATATGLIKVNVTMRVVPESEPALTLVRFKAVTEAEAFDAQVKAAIEKRTAPILQRLESKEKELDALIRKRTEREIAERLLRRGDVQKMRTHARNREHVILHVVEGHVIGEVGYLSYEIQNRSGSSYPLAAVRVTADGRNVTGDVHLLSTGLVRDSALIGVVAPGTTARGIATIPSVHAVLRRPLALEIGAANGRGTLRVDRGIELR